MTFNRLSSLQMRQKVVISAFFLFHFVVIVSAAIPLDFFLINCLHAKRLLTALAEKLGPYPATVGLTVGWSMFAPNPIHDNSYVEAVITYSDGREGKWSFPRMQELGYTERYVKERYRKFAAEELWKNSETWPGAAGYIARLNADPSNPPRTVRLIHYWTVIPSLSPSGEWAPSSRLRRDVFFSYSVNPIDLP